jgi:hypothetical protein
MNQTAFCDTAAMQFHRATTHCTASRLTSPRVALLKLSLVLLAASTASQLRAQTPPAQQPPTAPQQTPLHEAPDYTLHVYTNLVQIPTLVLSPSLLTLPPISLDQFNISLDSGPSFHPTHLHMEGDDPIDLAIFLDISYDDNLQSVLSSSISDFATHSLQPHDHVSIYVIGCALIRTANSLPATNGDQVAQALDIAIHAPQLHRARQKDPACVNSIHLWNALASVAESFSDAPARRIILAISTGKDHRSKVKWNILKRYADSRSITIFGLYPLDNAAFRPLFGSENPFNQLCQLTGGMVLFTSPLDVSTNLKHVVDLVRGRYILEFPRPDKSLPGEHRIDITLANSDAFIRAAGVAIPLPDPTLLSAPTTVPSPASPAVYGSRHPLQPRL